MPASSKTSKPKIRYEVDPLNRLVCRATGRKSGISRYRTVIDGKFTVGNDNELGYMAACPQAGGEKKIRLKGKWALDTANNLVYELDSSAEGTSPGKLKFKSEIIHADSNSLAFALETRNAKGTLSLYTLALSGRWQADERNRLCFSVEGKAGKSRALTLNAAWELDKNNRLSCKLAQKGGRISGVIAFEGRWEINEKDRLTYSLSKSEGSAFVFSGQFDHYDRVKKALVYRLAAGLSPKKKELSLKGTWKLDAKTGLVFEMTYADGRADMIAFGAECAFGDGTKLNLRLKNSRGRDVGIEVELERGILNGAGGAFLRAGASRGAFELTAGAGWRF